MTRSRPLVGMMVGLVALLLTGAGPAAYAAMPLPDPVAPEPAPATPLPAPLPEMTVRQEVGWLLTGAVIVLLAVVIVLGTATLVRRHALSRRLQLP